MKSPQLEQAQALLNGETRPADTIFEELAALRDAAPVDEAGAFDDLDEAAFVLMNA